VKYIKTYDSYQHSSAGLDITLQNSIISIIEYYWYYNIEEEEEETNFFRNQCILISTYLKEPTMNMLQKHGFIYRGLKDIEEVKEDYYYQPVVSWTFDKEIAQKFSKPQHPQHKAGVVLTKSASEYKDKILFSMDIFMHWVKSNYYESLESELQEIIDGYYSENEILCLP
jgi:hypothetical protein